MSAIIFDLDGTLVDSLPSIAAECNTVFEQLSLPSLPVPLYRTFAGGGNAFLLASALEVQYKRSPTSTELSQALSLKRAIDKKLETHVCPPFQGISQLLIDFTKQGIPMAVLSNKAEGLVKKAVQENFPEIGFLKVAGARDDTPLKPDPTAALQIVKELFKDVNVEDVVFVGDTKCDMETAKRGGMKGLGVNWGFHTEELLREAGAEEIVGDVEGIRRFMEKLRTGKERRRV